MKRIFQGASATVLAISALVLSSCGPRLGGQLGSVSNDSASIIGGTDATGEEAFAKTIVALYNTRIGSLCTASILSNEILLTAAHCVDGGSPTDLVVVFNRNLEADNLVVRRVAKAKTSDGWDRDQDNELDTGDIALVQFVGGLPEGFHPAKLLTDASQLKVDGEVLLAGYGLNNGVNNTGSGILRSVSTKIKNPGFSRTEVLINQTEGRGACRGDSGGPAYITVNGEQLLFGVTSRGVDDPNNDCSRFAAYTNALAYKEWIARVIEEMRARPVPMANTSEIAPQPNEAA